MTIRDKLIDEFETEREGDEERIRQEELLKQQQAQEAQLAQAGQQLAVKGMPQVSPEVIEQAVQNIQT